MNGPLLHFVTSFLLSSFIKENICIFQMQKHIFKLVFVVLKNRYKRKGGRNLIFKYFLFLNKRYENIVSDELKLERIHMGKMYFQFRKFQVSSQLPHIIL